VSLIFYASHLNPLFKWVGIIFFALFGVALAFLPFQDRPLDRWVVAFFKAVYSPTIFSWKEEGNVGYFLPEGKDVVSGEVKIASEKTVQPKFLSGLEETEKALLARFNSLFSGDSILTKKNVAPQQVTPQDAADQKPKLTIPETGYVKVTPTPQQQHQKIVVEEKGYVPQPIENIKMDSSFNPALKTSSEVEATFSKDAAPPSPPTTPNTLSGQVMDSQGKIVEAAILEIRDIGERPVRAVKTNKLGHFFIVTPLANGSYKVVTEKDNLNFDTATFEAEGNLIPPIAIRAKNALEELKS